MIRQLMVEGMNEYGDRFSSVAWNQPTIYELIIKQSCRLRIVFWKQKVVDRKDPCYGLLP